MFLVVLAATAVHAQPAVPKPQAPASAPVQKPPAAPADAASALDSLGNSLQDLNAIRDGNLTRVQRDGCPPETAARLADLRVRLRQAEAQLSGEAPANDSRVPDDMPAIASGWFKPVPQEQAESTSARESRLIGEVLPGASATALKAIQPAQSAQQRKALEDEIARVKAEITRLSGSCAAVRK